MEQLPILISSSVALINLSHRVYLNYKQSKEKLQAKLIRCRHGLSKKQRLLGITMPNYLGKTHICNSFQSNIDTKKRLLIDTDEILKSYMKPNEYDLYIHSNSDVHKLKAFNTIINYINECKKLFSSYDIIILSSELDLFYHLKVDDHVVIVPIYTFKEIIRKKLTDSKKQKFEKQISDYIKTFKDVNYVDTFDAIDKIICYNYKLEKKV
jgi:galactitol-specific phosphotransferase system IIB component